MSLTRFFSPVSLILTIDQQFVRSAQPDREIVKAVEHC
jgi:hypothetical protein